MTSSVPGRDSSVPGRDSRVLGRDSGRESRPTASASRDVSGSEARRVAEAARETEWARPSFVRELFLGRLRMDLIDPFPQPAIQDGEAGEHFLAELEGFLRGLDPLEMDEGAGIAPEVLDGLKRLGAFGIKIPKEYGGLGFSQRTYSRAMALCHSHSSAISVLLSAHQSIGVPQPVRMFGTPEQKRKYLPRVAKGAISGFALTEPDVGSDPARITSEAVPTEDGEAFILNGEKLWCTNGPVAELLVVMARTPHREGGRSGITAFIIEMDSPGISVEHRCSFMGLQGIENAVLRFRDVRIPRENLLLEEGRGLKLALATLNAGRLSIPWVCAATGKWCVQVSREWATVRRQWGVNIGRHEAVAHMISGMAADTFAMQAIAELAVALSDSGEYDIRLEAALAKLYNSEVGWRVVDDAMQIRGGRGYETAASLARRGEPAIGVEQVLRSMRINRIFEGSSEIMRLFIAREALDPHLQAAGAVLDPDASPGRKARDAVRLGGHMAGWLGGTLTGGRRRFGYRRYGSLAGHLAFADRSARRLARTLARAMVRYGPKLEQRQAVLFRLVDVGGEIFAMAAACAWAQKRLAEEPDDRTPLKLADMACRRARRRIDSLFRRIFDPLDGAEYAFAQEVMAGDYGWMEKGILEPPAPMGFERPVERP